LQKTYSYNPTPPSLTPDQQKHILGAQANLWTEYIPTEAKADYMLLPRLLAVSELNWTPLANKNFNDFANMRLPYHLAWLDKNNFDYRVPPAIGAKDTIVFGSQLNAQLKPSVVGATIFYTIDSYTPRETDLIYSTPLSYNVPQDQFRELETIVITPSGKRSVVTHTVMWNKSPLPPVNYNGTTSGLKYELYSGTFTGTADLDKSVAIDTGIVKSFNQAAIKKSSLAFGVIYSGFIHIDNDGVYNFSTQSDDGSVLLIDGVPVVNNDGKHGSLEQGGSIPLQKGFHHFTLKYYNVGTTATLHVYLTIPGKPKGELSPDELYY